MRKLRISSFCLALLCCSALASPFESLPVYTGDWAPYVREPGETQGPVTRVVELALREMRYEPQPHYLDFYLAYDMVKEGELRFAYPYFQTRQRMRNDPGVLFSDPIVEVSNGMFYSRQHNDLAGQDLDIADLRVGQVSGYSYGEQLEPFLEGAEIFQSEVLALKALFDGRIDLLPMTEKVGEALVLEHFPLHYPEWRRLPGEAYRSRDSVHAITVNDEEGQAFMQEFNAALARIGGRNMIDEVLETLLEPPQSSGYVRLVAGGNHPVVIGQTHENSESPDNRYLMIPHGSRALVLRWSDAVLNEHVSQQLYPSMMQLSRVRVVDGPHVGRELFVKNLHIEIE